MQKTIFIVDDNDTNLAKAETALDNDYRIITLSSAGRMFKILKKRVPDLILLDINMPEINGWEALKQLKSNDEYAHIPVIFLTATDDEAMKTRGMEAGAIDFVVKPFTAEDLLARVKQYV